MRMYDIRTDLALEQKERFEAEKIEINGVVVEEEYDEEKEIRITTVVIETEKGAKTMGKPTGTYITLEAPNMIMEDEDYHRNISEEIVKHLKNLIPVEKEEYSVLVVGLGNQKITPDALGPLVVDNLHINRHLIREYGKYAMDEEMVECVSAIVPGVMGQTGMETVEIIRGVVSETQPDFIVAIDALAARNFKRLSRTIQIADTGINPGSGVGNHRNAITEKTVGVPVLAIGVPTVVDAATIVNDAMENLISGLNSMERYDITDKIVAPHLNGMFVTPKDIDETVKRISYTISEALNILFSNLYSYNDAEIGDGI